MEEKLIPCIVGVEGVVWSEETYSEGDTVFLPPSVAVTMAGGGFVTMPADAFPEGEPDPEETPANLEASGEEALLEDVTAEPTEEPGPQVEEVKAPAETITVEISEREIRELHPAGWQRWLQSEDFGHWLIEQGFDPNHRILRERVNDRFIFKGAKA